MKNTALYTGVGCELTHYEMDIKNAGLIKRSSMTLPSNVHYAWPHPTAPFLYVACSTGGPDTQGSLHCLVVIHTDPDSGTLILQNPPFPLPARPIHTTVDRTGQHVLTAYNFPSSVTVHRIQSDGAVGGLVKQEVQLDTGIYPHQVRMLPSGDAVVVVARGNAAKDSRPEDPGSLRVFSLNNGQLSSLTSVAPNGGYDFGPRHLDFHPNKPWLYVSLETQNLMHMYHMSANFLAPLPTYVKPTLADYSGRRRRQRPGTIHVHPNGRFVYVANRASGTRDINGQQVFIGGENSIAAFEIDQNSGEPNAIQHEDTRGIVPRTFALDKTGRLLVVANSVSILTQENGASRTVPTSLSVFKVGDDGKLSFVKKYDIETGNESIHWMGIVG